MGFFVFHGNVKRHEYQSRIFYDLAGDIQDNEGKTFFRKTEKEIVYPDNDIPYGMHDHQERKVP